MRRRPGYVSSEARRRANQRATSRVRWYCRVPGTVRARTAPLGPNEENQQNLNAIGEIAGSRARGAGGGEYKLETGDQCRPLPPRYFAEAK